MRRGPGVRLFHRLITTSFYNLKATISSIRRSYIYINTYQSGLLLTIIKSQVHTWVHVWTKFLRSPAEIKFCFANFSCFRSLTLRVRNDKHFQNEIRNMRNARINQRIASTGFRTANKCMEITSLAVRIDLKSAVRLHTHPTDCRYYTYSYVDCNWKLLIY